LGCSKDPPRTYLRLNIVTSQIVEAQKLARESVGRNDQGR